MCAARLALFSSMSEAHKRARVEGILPDLSLSKCETIYIGFPNIPDVSDGKRSRAVVGVELATESASCFLDDARF